MWLSAHGRVRLASNRLISALDFGSDRVIALVAHKKEDGKFELVGAGDAKAQGVKPGVIENVGDAVESVYEAVSKAENAAGIKIKSLYYNFDDPLMKCVRSKGALSLKGEGEIQPADIEEAESVARRLVGHFDYNIVYAKSDEYLIDDKDMVLNPTGVFARRLEVSMHILQARAQFCQDWEKIMRRCHFSKTERVLTAWSVARAVTVGQDSVGKKLIVDLGADYTNVFIYGRESILDIKTILTAQKSDIRGDKRILSAKELLAKHSDIQEILVTGDLAEEEHEKQAWVEMAEGIPVRPAAPQGLVKLSQPRYASAVGLLWAADELMKKSPALNKEKTFMGGMKQKARTFIQEYF